MFAAKLQVRGISNLERVIERLAKSAEAIS